MQIKKFESFSGDEPYLQKDREDFTNAFDGEVLPLDDKDLFFIINKISFGSGKIIIYTTISKEDGRYRNKHVWINKEGFSHEYFNKYKVYKINVPLFTIFKDFDYFYWVQTSDGKYFKCDELSGLKELIKKLGLYIGE